MSDKLLSPTLPVSIANDKNIQDLSNILDITLADIRRKTELILLLPRLNELPDNILDELAYQFHVDFYRDNFEHDIKIKLIETSILSHRLKGTPYAVEKVCTDVFKSAKVLENWEYGGKPYHFKVSLISEAVTDADRVYTLIDVINSAKNVRSWCDEIGFITKTDSNITVTGSICIFDRLTLSELEYDLKNGSCDIAMQGTVQIFDKLIINERTNTNG